MEHKKERTGKLLNKRSFEKRMQKKYQLPVIAHFSDRSIEFSSIIQAETVTGIHYTLIFEACIGKIFKTKNVIFEYKKGNHYIKYKARYVNAQAGNFKRKVGFNG